MYLTVLHKGALSLNPLMMKLTANCEVGPVTRMERRDCMNFTSDVNLVLDAPVYVWLYVIWDYTSFPHIDHYGRPCLGWWNLKSWNPILQGRMIRGYPDVFDQALKDTLRPNLLVCIKTRASRV